MSRPRSAQSTWVCATGLWLAMTSGMVGAQTSDELAALDASERQRIASVRAQAMAQFAQQEQDCQSKFAVHACVQELAVQQRALLEDLKQQEYRLNDLQRQQRGVEQLQRLQDRQAAQEVNRSEQMQEAMVQTAAERLQAQRDKVSAHANMAPLARSPSLAPQQGLSQAQENAHRTSYEAKQKQVAQKQQERLSRLQSRSASIKSLPVPP